MSNRWRMLGVTMLAVCLAAGAWAQSASQRQLRTVKGQVVDKDDNPAGSSIVYLKNTKTQIIRTHIVESTGQYRFSGLDPNVDYEIHAENDSAASARKTISSLDGRREITINLKLDKKKE
jgi:hypothetical protein